MEHVIDRRGFVISKDAMDGKTLKKYREALTVKPVVNPDYVMKPTVPYPVYTENDTFIYLPRFYGRTLGLPFREDFTDLKEMSRLNSIITLRDYQKPVIDAAMKSLKDTGGGFLACGTGTGKTSMALYLACKLRVKTLVIVHKSFLLQQWKSRIEDFIPHAKVGIIQGPTIDVDDKDIVIGMLQSIATKKYAKHVFEGFGFVIADEAHHLSAEVFCRALPKVASKYMLGLSATPKRKDGLTKVFKWYLGDIAYTLDRSDTDSVLVKRVIFNCSDTAYGKEKKNHRGNVLLPTMITQLATCEARNTLIVDQAAYYVQEDRQVMIISDRLAHLTALKEEFDARKVRIARNGEEQIATSGFYTGKQKQKELDINEKKNVIFSSYGLVREGLDIQSLNTIIFATPVSDVIQACGRIMRKTHECNPLIIDIIDQFSIFFAQARKREQFYEKAGYNVFKRYYDADRQNAEDIHISTSEMQTEVENARICVDDTCLDLEDDAPAQTIGFLAESSDDE